MAMAIWTVQQRSDMHDVLDMAYVGWNKAYATLEEAKAAVVADYAEAMECEVAEVEQSWVLAPGSEGENERWAGVLDGDPEYVYGIVRATLG